MYMKCPFTCLQNFETNAYISHYSLAACLFITEREKYRQERESTEAEDLRDCLDQLSRIPGHSPTSHLLYI